MRRKILLVDDNKDLLELLRLNFKGAGFAIATATNGLEALRKARSQLPDLILLDLLLPELDGFGVCERLRKDPSTSAIPILIMSGLTGQFAKYAGLESGGTDFITKPSSPSAIIARIKEMLLPK
jgi:two-component system alkaline phosphatase synthesis response regulator PhoP